MTIKRSDDVAADQSGFVSRRVGSFDSIERNTALRCVEGIDAKVRARRRGCADHWQHTPLTNELRGHSGQYKKTNHGHKYPRNAAHAFLSACHARGGRTLNHLSITHAKGIRPAIGQAHCLCVLSDSFTKAEAAVSTKPETSRHRRVTIRARDGSELLLC